jgi:hypothetical protein
MKTPEKTFTNAATGIMSYVFDNGAAGFSVTIQDVDSGEFFAMSHRFPRSHGIEAAIAKAKEIL